MLWALTRTGSPEQDPGGCECDLPDRGGVSGSGARPTRLTDQPKRLLKFLGSAVWGMCPTEGPGGIRILNDVGRDPAGTPPWIRFGLTRELAQGAQGPESKCPGSSLINSHMLCTCSWPDFTILSSRTKDRHCCWGVRQDGLCQCPLGYTLLPYHVKSERTPLDWMNRFLFGGPETFRRVASGQRERNQASLKQNLGFKLPSFTSGEFESAMHQTSSTLSHCVAEGKALGSCAAVQCAVLCKLLGCDSVQPLDHLYEHTIRNTCQLGEKSMQSTPGPVNPRSGSPHAAATLGSSTGSESLTGDVCAAWGDGSTFSLC